jgi:filamentous hemagglutinin
VNKVYRLVWSDRQQGFVAVPEFARSCGKGGELVLVAALTLSALFAPQAGAQVNVASGNTTVTNAANLVPVVAIATTNAAGLSHNKYTNFNVAANGLVLNNNASAGAVASQLAVTVAKNANLSTGAARLILNEVVTNNRSALKGYMEVAGTRADVVVANPWGITCNGCGFINTDRATLSTGVPVIAGDGSLDRMRVGQGDILINGAGLNGESQNILDIVARSVVVDGQIKANDLRLVAGSNDYNYAARTATAIAGSGAAPSYAIDSTALGGMYAQRISLIATEQGVGVRMLGDVAARGSDFTLSAAGAIELRAKSISASGDIAVTTANSLNNSGAIEASGRFSGLGGGDWNNQGRIIGAQGFTLDLASLMNGSASNYSARIASTQDVGDFTNASSISAKNGVVNYGAIHSADDLSISARTIQNQSTGGITSGRGLDLAAVASIDNRGALYSGDRGLDLQGSTITNYTGGTIEAVTGISAKSSIFNNYSLIRAENISVTADTSFYNGLEAQITPVMDFGTQVASSENEAIRQIDFWQQDKTCLRCDERWLFQDAVTYREQYSSPLPAVKPQMLALDTLNLNYGAGTATNFAGILSGDLVSITGTGKFTNRDLSLAEVTYYRRAADDKEDHWQWLYGSLHTFLAATAAIPLTNATLSDAERKTLRSKKPPYTSEVDAIRYSALFEKSRVNYSGTGAGVYANTLRVSAGQVENLGSPLSYNDSRLAQGGFSIALPTNPNGHYVLSGDPKSRYRVVTNADFLTKAAEMNSYELEKLMGYNPDDELQRLGDDDYENDLIRQQLVDKNAAQRIAGNDASEINRLRSNSLAEFKAQKLTYGKELSPEQIKNLGSDIVWMVKTRVGGKDVLVPRVYLSESSRAMLKGGAVLAAQNTTIEAASVTNRGATIAGAQNLAIKTAGNIANESGTMTGGNVSLAAAGNIVNKTVTQGQGNSRSFKTTVGKTGLIEATTGSLVISSGQQITIQGAAVKAAQEASLTAVGAVAVNSLVDKTTSSTSVSTPRPVQKKSKKNTKFSKNTTTTTEQGIGSTLAAGGTLNVTSGADITVSGSSTKAGAVALNSKGDVKILAEQNKTTMHSEAKNSGRGVGGGLWGKKKQTSDESKSTNSGSTVAAAGNGTINSTGKLVVQGSQVKIGGDAKLNAKQGIDLVAGKDEVKSVTKTETKTFLKIGDGKGTNASANKPVAKAPAADGQANAKAAVGVAANSKHDLKLFESTTTTQKQGESTNVGSTLTVGGNLNASTDKTLTVQGSSVNTGKEMNLNADKVVVQAGTSSKEVSTDTSRISLGLFEESQAKASAQAKADARGANGGAAGVSANAKASAESTITVGVKTESDKQKTSSTTNTSAALTSGGNMNVTAQKDVTFAGAQVVSGGNLGITGANITNAAVQDVSATTSSKDSHLAGVYVAGSASAGASANAATQVGIGASIEVAVKVEAKAEATAGVRYKNEQEKSAESKTTQVTNTFTAANDVTRTAGGTLADQGTQIQAGGSLVQKAQVITDQAVSNSTSKTASSQSHDARIGVHAGASAEAGASANATLIGPSAASAKADASAGLGVKASYLGATTAKEENKTTAVTSSYTAGKDISSTSTDKTTVTGANFAAGNKVDIQAGTLEFNAAKDTTRSSGTTNDINAQVTATIVGTPGVNASGGYAGKIESAKSSTEHGGSIKAGGDVTVKSGGDASFTGTQINSAGKTAVAASGDVKFNAAQSTSQSSTQDISANAGIKVGGGSVGGNAGVAYGKSDKSTTTGQGATIAGAGGVDVTAGKSATFEGTKVQSAGDVNVAAGEKVNLLATTKRETKTTFNVGAGINGKQKVSSSPAPSASGGDKPTAPAPSRGGSVDQPTEPRSGAGGGSRNRPESGSAGASPEKPSSGNATPAEAVTPSSPNKPPSTGINAGLLKSDKVESTVTSVAAGGKVNIKGSAVVDQEAKTTGQQVTIEGGREARAKTSVNTTSGFEFTAGAPTKK